MNVLGINRHFGRLLGIFAFLSLAFAIDIYAATPTRTGSVMVSSPQGEIVEMVPMEGMVNQPVMQGSSPCCECVPCERPGHRHPLRDNLSSTTCFNCQTNGSYKFPVPRQYTYFWPGIYSQKTMTEYIAPYCGLKLRTPAEVFDTDAEISK